MADDSVFLDNDDKTSCVCQSLAQAYATTTCSIQCAPFKNSPGTYATCCKQHAATAAVKPAPKPVALQSRFPKPVSGIIKSRFPKPLTSGQLHQGQVTKVVGTLDTEKGRPTPLKQLQNAGGPIVAVKISNDISENDNTAIFVFILIIDSNYLISYF